MNTPPTFWDYLVKPGNELQPDLQTLIALKMFDIFKFLLIASLPALREMTYLLALFCWIGGIMGIKKSFQYGGGALGANIFLGLMQIVFKNI